MSNSIFPSAASSVIEALEDHPDDWSATAHHLTHKPSGLVMWIANGGAFCGVARSSKHHLDLGLFARWRIYRAYLRWHRRKAHFLMLNCLGWGVNLPKLLDRLRQAEQDAIKYDGTARLSLPDILDLQRVVVEQIESNQPPQTTD